MAVKSELTNFKEIARVKLVIVEMQNSKSGDKRAKAISKSLFLNKQKNER